MDAVNSPVKELAYKLSNMLSELPGMDLHVENGGHISNGWQTDHSETASDTERQANGQEVSIAGPRNMPVVMSSRFTPGCLLNKSWSHDPCAYQTCCKAACPLQLCGKRGQQLIQNHPAGFSGEHSLPIHVSYVSGLHQRYSGPISASTALPRPQYSHAPLPGWAAAAYSSWGRLPPIQRRGQRIFGLRQ